MFRVFYCLTGEHDWRLVVLAVFVCLLASLVAVSLFHRARVAHARSRQAWLLLAGAATGCGIWATHFIAMLAYEPSVPVSYDAGLTAASFAVATLVTIAGLSARPARRRVGPRRSAAQSSVPVSPACIFLGCGLWRCPAM